MSMRRLEHVSLIICCLCAVGCDPVRTTQQSVRLQVVDSTSDTPVAGVQLQLKYDFNRAEPLSKETLEPREALHKGKREFWEAFPWSCGVSGRDGQVQISIEYTSLDRTSGCKPPASRDMISGKPYQVKVKAGEVPEEELSVVMKHGASVKTKFYTVTVLEIQEPQYVETSPSTLLQK